jgi:hypothetical protein
VRKRAARKQEGSGKQGALEPPACQDAEKHRSAENVTIAPCNPFELIRQLQTEALNSDLTRSESAFETLSQMFHELHVWLQTMTALHPMSLRLLLGELPEDKAWTRYKHGEHVGAWAGAELGRFYRQTKADLRSCSRHSVNPVRVIRVGFKAGKLDFPANRWFLDEYERRTDYRPSGRMAVWVARKIEDVRRLKANRSRWRIIAGYRVERQLHVRSESEIEALLSEWFRSDVVSGEETLKILDALPGFGSSDRQGFEGWRKFIRRRILTNAQLLSEFDQLFPDARRKLDGVIAATLRSVWQTLQRGGNVLLPRV